MRMKGLEVRVIVFSATFNNISAISSPSVLLIEETEYPEKTTNLSQVTDKLVRIIQCNKETKSYYHIQVDSLSYVYIGKCL